MDEVKIAPDKLKKQMQAMLYAIKNYQFINRTKLMKFIFFIDLFYYNKTDTTLLEDSYIRLPNGPVPKFGFSYTSPKIGETCTVTDEFTINKITTDNEGKYYHYQFTLKQGVSPDLSIFKPVEIDLMNLTLQTVMSRKTADLSDISHSYKLWSNYKNSETIKLKDFALSDDEMENLEIILNTKIYLNPINKSDNKSNKPKTEVEKKDKEMPKKLPVYINTATSEPIIEGY